jgi:hypothetical protein
VRLGKVWQVADRTARGLDIPVADELRAVVVCEDFNTILICKLIRSSLTAVVQSLVISLTNRSFPFPALPIELDH